MKYHNIDVKLTTHNLARNVPDGAEPRVVDHGVPDVGAVGGRVGEVPEGGVVLVRLPKHLGNLQNLKKEDIWLILI